MPVLKSPERQPKNETLQLRVSQDVKFRLTRYAEFIDASPSYIVAELLERLFRKDAEFQSYVASYKPQELAKQQRATETSPIPEGTLTDS
ncbi:MAG: hypothetical protein WAK20_22025 [Candidatus Acidiferrum sp.]